MICLVTILHQRCSFILIPSLNQNWIHRISIWSNWKTHYFKGRESFFSNQETATNGCEDGQNHRRDMTKGKLFSASRLLSGTPNLLAMISENIGTRPNTIQYQKNIFMNFLILNPSYRQPSWMQWCPCKTFSMLFSIPNSNNRIPQ